MKNGLLSLAYLFATGAALLLTPTAHAAVVISDTFSDDGALNGSAPDLSPGGATWQASGGGSASGGVYSVTTTGTQTSVIDLGSNYFANPGVYTLSATVTMPTATSSTSWLGIGFVANPVLNGHMGASGTLNGLQGTTGNNAGQPWMFLRQNGQLNVYRGPGTSAQTSAISTTFTAGTAYTLSLVLNTTGANWFIDAYVDGVQLDLNGATAGNSSVFASNPTDDLRYVGFSQNGGSFGTITLDNFTLDAAPVPEPTASLALAGAGLLLLGIRRRVNRA